MKLNLSMISLQGKETKLSSKHYLLFLIIGILGAIVIGMLYFEDHEEPAVCGEDCHEANYQCYNNPQENSVMAAHLENDVTCWDCHSGEEIKDKSEDPHGEITVGNCLADCHEDVDWLIEAPQTSLGEEDQTRLIWHPHTDNGTNVDELKTLESCMSCHDPRANTSGFGAETCMLCHDITLEEMERHGENTCSFSSCHQEGPELRVDKTGHIEVEGHCNKCHNDLHPQEALVSYNIEFENNTFSVNTSFCGSCHEGAIMALNDTGGPHEGEPCHQCHQEHDKIQDCTTCHTENDVPHTLGELYDECSSCHVEGGHDPNNIEFFTYPSQTLSENFCSSSSCHAADVYEVVNGELDGRLHGQEDYSEDCLSCHQTHSKEVPCFSCHDVKKEPEHRISVPYDNCTRCHIDGHDNENITFINFDDMELDKSFCEECHEGASQEIMDGSPGHSPLACHKCHEDARGDAVDCAACHSTNGMANPTGHLTETPFNECGQCHDSGHNPRQISYFNVSFESNDFCATCHTDEPMNQYTIFYTYGGQHKQELITCTPFCHTDHSAEITCTTVQCHWDTLYPVLHSPYQPSQCVKCHNSAHDPNNAAPQPGRALSQRDYMSNYYIFSKIRLKESFAWNPRGNHEQGVSCSQCHNSPEEARYTNSSLSVIKSTGTDCSQGCHGWIDPNNAGDPFLLINASVSRHNTDIFNNASRGGCAGYCHQMDPEQPDVNGTGHGIIANCLNSKCHGDGFEGSNQTHMDHREGLEDAGLDCFMLCHTDDTDHSDCYGCHNQAAKNGTIPTSASRAPAPK